MKPTTPQSSDKRYYQKQMEAALASFGETKPTLLLHACCAPCASYSLEYLTPYFSRVTLFFCNPNITPAAEYDLRLRELERLIREMPLGCPVDILPAEYDPERFFAMAKGLESLPEGGSRCWGCYDLRIRETAARAGEYDWFTTTLSISPHKNAAWLNAIGEKAAADTGTRWLPTDLKKNGGYQRSIQLSAQYGLYRQSWCGCDFSRRDNAGK